MFYDHAIRNTIEIVVLADVLIFFRDRYTGGSE